MIPKLQDLTWYVSHPDHPFESSPFNVVSPDCDWSSSQIRALKAKAPEKRGTNIITEINAVD